MNQMFRALMAALLMLAAGPLYAGTTNYTFQTDPTQWYTSDGYKLISFAGNHNWTNSAGANYCWSANNGQADGYLSLVDNIANEGLGLVFPFLDASNAPVTAFTIDMDLRIGNPTNANARPADGFSISLARPMDLAISNIIGNPSLGVPSTLNGFAGGGSVWGAQAATPGSGTVENGTKTGLSFSFDAYQGGWLADGAVNTNGTTDIEGFSFRVDDMTLAQVLLPDRNCNCSNATCAASSYTDINSIQTGPFMGTTNLDGFAHLYWQHLKIQMTNNQFTVIWKGRTLLSTNYPYWSPTAGQLVIAARTGGNCENVHLDNLAITTYPGTNSYLQNIAGTTYGFTFTLADFSNAVTSVSQVLLDGTNDVTGLLALNNASPLHVGTVILPTNLVSYTRHTAAIIWQTAGGNTVSATNAFLVPVYTAVPTNGVVALSALDTTKPGFSVKAWQTRQNNPNSLPWTEHQVLGRRGNNLVGAASVASEGGYLVWDGALDLDNVGSTSQSSAGYFSLNYDFNLFGIASTPPPLPNGNYDQMAMELFGYIYFPTSGYYNFVFGNDDSYQLSLSQSPYDRMGNVIASMQGNRVPTPLGPPVGTDIQTYYIGQAGCYPFRLLYENGGGGAALEWYTYDPNDTVTPYKLVNDTNTPGALLTYRATASSTYGPYIKQAVPVRNDQYVTFYQPVEVDLADGTGNLAVDPLSISLKIDGVAQNFAVSNKIGDTTHLVQAMSGYWTNVVHTNLLSFNDLNGTNYTYSWSFTVLNGVVSFTNGVINLPSTARVDPSTVSQPGMRVRSYQTYFKQANSLGTAEEQLAGLHGPNFADQGATNGPGFFVWTGVVDFRKPSGTGTGGGGEFNYDFDFANFGFHSLQQASGANNIDNGTMEIGTWLVFPSAGLYIFDLNTDDGCALLMPFAGNPLNRLGTLLTYTDAGRGSAGASAGLAGGNYAVVNVPVAGAYPFRYLMENGTSDSAIEWSIYQPLPDGTVCKVPVNDLGNPNSIRAYQVCSSSGAYISYANPAPLSKDIVFYQPIVVDITDGTAGQATIDSMSVDGVALSSPTTYRTNGNTSHFIWTPSAPWTPNLTHTNVLVYHDSAGSYSNYWVFTTLNISAYGILQLPLTNMVPYSALDLTQPGVRIKSYQVTTNILGNTIPGWEGVLEGLSGPNIADQTLTNGPGFFVDNFGPIDFDNAPTGGANSGGGEWEWDYNFNLFGIQFNTTGSSGNTANLENYCALDIGTYLYFAKAGNYIMEVDADDDFRLSSPFGNPFNKVGTVLAWVEGGHGAANAGFGPRTGTSYVSFNVPAPGAYPFRLLFGNITGGGSLEWNIFEYLADGSVAQVLINDTNTPGTVQAFQVSTQDTPYVAYVSPVPGNIYGPAQPAITLSGNTLASFATNSGPVQQDIVIGLADAATSVNTNTLQLSLNGMVQPINIVQSNGLTYVTRPGNASQWWPSGQVGTLMLSFQDNLGRTVNMPLTTIATPFWGTLANGLPLGRGDTNKPGFLIRTYGVDPLGSTQMPTRVHVAEQVLAGIWGINKASASTPYAMATANGYDIAQGTGRLQGVVNFTIGALAGDFQSPTNTDQMFPGIPDTDVTANYRTNSFVEEILAYVEFPTAGTYTLGVNSDDGFRLTQGFNAPTNKGALFVNSPASLAGFKPTVQDTFLASYSLTNFVSGNLVLAQGPYTPANQYGSTNHNGLGYSIDGCIINNGAQLAGNIALMYRSAYCGYAQQVQNAAAAGAVAVVLIQNRPTANGWFPEEAGVTPMQPIPTVMVDQATGNKLIAALTTNAVNVTLTPMDYLINPPAALSPLAQVDAGRGASDTLFPVVVPQAGVYPLRLLYFQGGGAGSLEFFSVDSNGQRMLINDAFWPGALKSYSAVTLPTLKITSNGANLTITFTGTLKTSADPSVPLANWTTVSGSSPLVIPISSSAAQQYYRAVFSQ